MDISWMAGTDTFATRLRAKVSATVCPSNLTPGPVPPETLLSPPYLPRMFTYLPRMSPYLPQSFGKIRTGKL
jgi:hypothetical protein